MQDQTFPWLTTLIVVPLVGAAIVWGLPAGARRHSRHVAVGASLVVLALAVVAALGFDTARAGEHQLTELTPWIPSFGVSYALGVDGVGLALVLLSVVLVPLVLLAAWREHPDAASMTRSTSAGDDDASSDVAPATATRLEGGNRVRHYVALVLVLEALMVAV